MLLDIKVYDIHGKVLVYVTFSTINVVFREKCNLATYKSLHHSLL